MPITIEDMKLYTVQELSKLLDVTIITLREYIRQGKLRGQKVGGKWIVTYDSLKEFLDGTYKPKKKVRK